MSTTVLSRRWWLALTALLTAAVASASNVRAQTQPQSQPPVASAPPASSAAPVQQATPSSSFADAAVQVAQAFDGMKVKKVAVFDFVNAKSPRWDRLGQQLAGDFRLRLDAAPHQFTQLSRADILKAMKRETFEQDDVNLSDVAAYALTTSKADAFVVTTMKPSIDNFTLYLSFFVYDARKDGDPTRIDATILLSPDLLALVPPAAPSESVTLPEAGRRGISQVKCDSCPEAAYTKAAEDARCQGTVYLYATIEPDGRAGDIRIVKGLPYGLNAAAISAVRKWRFHPARNEDGKAVAVGQPIEVQFRLY